MAERQPPREEQTCETCDTLQLDGCEDPECPYGDSGGAYYPYANATGFPDDEDRGKTIDRIPATEKNESPDVESAARCLISHIGELEQMRDGIAAVDRINRKTGRGVSTTDVLGDIRTEAHSEQLEAFHALADLLDDGDSQ